MTPSGSGDCVLVLVPGTFATIQPWPRGEKAPLGEALPPWHATSAAAKERPPDGRATVFPLGQQSVHDHESDARGDVEDAQPG
jgi:hypothetical protein